MRNVVTFLKSKRYYALVGGIIILLFLIRSILLATPSTELTYTVKKEDLVDTVQVSGTYTTASQTNVVSPSNGVIDKLFVANGNGVKKGDPLFHVQSTVTDDQKKSANAAYLAAESVLKADNADLYSLQSAMYSAWKKYTDLATNSTYQNSDGSPDTTNRVLTEFTTSQDNWLAAEAGYKNQQAVIAKDQAALSAAQQLYNETQSVTVTAPISGTIENLLLNPGDEVTANNASVLIAGKASGQANITSSVLAPILVISNLANPYIAADISEDYAVNVAKGEDASIVFDSLKNKTLTGTVLGINTVGDTTDGVVTYAARIDAADIPPGVKPGMTALVTIETLRKNNVLDVPNSAVIQKDNVPYVMLSGSHKLIPVEIGTQGVAKTEILQGISQGMTILANPNENS